MIRIDPKERQFDREFVEQRLQDRSTRLYERYLKAIRVRTDWLFAYLMMAQWLVAILVAIFLTPLAWRGADSTPHFHLYAATVLGGIVTLVPCWLAYSRPGEAITRHSLAIAQMSMSSLLIHLTGGRIETHFHIFGSLALLAFYRDWKVLTSAMMVVLLDHYLRGVYWPRSVFGTLTASHWRWIEHGGWVMFENIFLMRACVQGCREIRNRSDTEAKLQEMNSEFEQTVIDRTEEVNRREVEKTALMESSADAIITFDERLKLTSYNPAFEAMLGGEVPHADDFQLYELFSKGCSDSGRRHIESAHRDLRSGANLVRFEFGAQRLDGTEVPVEATVTLVHRDHEDLLYMWTLRDVSQKLVAMKAEEELHRQRVEMARLAGMSEIATGVLHNVGNALNSVNVSANLLKSSADHSRVNRLNDIANMLQEHEQQNELEEFLVTDEKGRKLPKYLIALNEQVKKERIKFDNELLHLLSHIDHIKTIVATQQSIAKPVGMTESVSLEKIVDEALQLHIGLDERKKIEIVRDYGVIPEISIDRPRLMQILFNLVSNAKESIRDYLSKNPKIIARLSNVDSDHVRIEIEDNGGGIEEKHLTRIFAHGFTTKQYGHGFGLHSSANTATELGGKLSVSSIGLGQGATFSLTLPVDATRKNGRELAGPERTISVH